VLCPNDLRRNRISKKNTWNGLNPNGFLKKAVAKTFLPFFPSIFDATLPLLKKWRQNRLKIG
jgi:hypothetical protein